MNFEGTPLVSVLMTSFNREKYIAEAIESVLASTYKNFELIIADDASYDSTVEIAKKYERADSRVKVYANPENLGQFANRNKAAEYASGKYIKYFDSDDVLYPHALQVMVDAMEKYPEAGAGSICLFNKYLTDLPRSVAPRELYLDHYFHGSNILTVGPSGTILRKSVFEKIGKFKVDEGILSDTLLMLKIAATHPVVALPTDLFFWRRHEGQVTEDQKKQLEMLKERYFINMYILNCEPSPLLSNERKIVHRNLKNIIIRGVLRIGIPLSIRQKLEILRIIKFRPLDLFYALFKNKKLTE